MNFTIFYGYIMKIKNIILFVILIINFSCSHVSYNEIKKGMSPDSVRNLVGSPQVIKTYPRDTYYFYQNFAVIFRDLQVSQVVSNDNSFVQYTLNVDAYNSNQSKTKLNKYFIKPLNSKLEGDLEFEKLAKKLKYVLSKLNYEFVDYNNADKIILLDRSIEEVTDSVTSSGVTIFNGSLAANESTSWANKSCIRKITYKEVLKSEYMKNETPKQLNLVKISSKGSNCNFIQVYPSLLVGLYNYIDFETESTAEMTVFSNDELAN